MPPNGASPVASIPLLHACRRHSPGGTGRCSRRSLPDPCQPSPNYRRVGLRIISFEACSAFTRVTARMVAESPLATRLIGVLQSMSLPSSTAPTATGWSDSCRAGFAPAEGWRLGSAHCSYFIALNPAISRFIISFAANLRIPRTAGLPCQSAKLSESVPNSDGQETRAPRTPGFPLARSLHPARTGGMTTLRTRERPKRAGRPRSQEPGPVHAGGSTAWTATG